MKDIDLQAFEKWWSAQETGLGTAHKFTAWNAWLARAAVEADRAQRLPDDFLSHRSAWRAAMVIAEGFAANEDDASYWRHELKAFDNAYSMLASTPEPAQQEPSEAEMVCAEAYQVVGCLLSDLGMFETEAARKILDNLSEARMVHQDVLPWESAAQHQEPPQQERKPMKDEDGLRVAINACDSLNSTRIHEIGGKTRTICDDLGLLDIVRAVERYHGIFAEPAQDIKE